MRLVNPEDPLVSNSDLIEDALKVLAEIEGPTERLREFLEEFQDWSKREFHQDHDHEPDCIVDAQLAAQELSFATEDDNPRGFSRDLAYISAVLEELERRAIEKKEGKLRKPVFFAFGQQPLPQEMDN